MQTQSEQPQQAQPHTPEDYRRGIEACNDLIESYRHEIRWFLWGHYAVLVLLATTLIIFAGIFPFGVAALNNVLGVIGFITGLFTVLLAALLGFSRAETKEIGQYLDRLRKTKQDIKKMKRRLAQAEEDLLRTPALVNYPLQTQKIIAFYRKKADWYRHWFIAIQLITIFMSAAITSLSGGWLDRYVALPWVIPVLSAIISILTSLTLFFKFREKSVNLQQTADEMNWECRYCMLGIGPYKNLSQEDKLTTLASKVEELLKDQQKRQLQLEQSSQGEQKALQANS